MSVIITGATGFIGSRLCQALLKEKYEVIALSRSIKKINHELGSEVKAVQWDGRSAAGWGELADGAYAIINLAGENVATGYWTKSKKEKIISSRLDAGRAVVEAVTQASQKPKVVVQASAIGYYGDRGEEILNESSSSGRGFLSEVTRKWEPSTQAVEDQGVRRIILRTGLVIDKSGGALPKMALPFRFFIGGHIGPGSNWVSWIHLDDEVGAMIHLMKNEQAQGPFNLVSPNPERMKDFTKMIGQALHRPSWMPVAAFAAKLTMGEMAQEMFLASQRVAPKSLENLPFKFLYPEAKPAIKEIFG